MFNKPKHKGFSVIWGEKDENKKHPIKNGDYVQCRLKQLLFHVIKIGIVSSDPDEDGYVQVLWVIDDETTDNYAQKINEVSSHHTSFLEYLAPEDIKNIKEKIRIRGDKKK